MNERDRLKEVEEYGILNTLPEKEFDDIVELASAVYETPVAIISIIGPEMTWFKAKTGVKETGTPRKYSFCTHMLKDPGKELIVNNALTDERFKNNPLVKGQHGIRFYAGIPLLTPAGSLIGALCIADKVTRTFSPEDLRILKILAARITDHLELRRTSLKLKQEKERSEALLQSISDNSPVAIYQFQIKPDGSMSFPFVSKSIEQINPGITAEMLKKDVSLGFKSIHPGDIGRVNKSIQDSYKNLTVWSMIYRVIGKDGDVKWHSGKARPEKKEDGTVIWYGVFQDITDEINEITLARESLRRSEERYHQMVNEVEDYVILLLDVDGNIQNWNKGAEKIKGYTSGEIIGKNFSVFYPESERKKNSPLRLLNQARLKGKATDEGLRVKKDGSVFWASVVITALHDDNGEIIGFSKVTRDYTEIRNYILAIEEQNKKLREIAWTQSHIVRAPLSRIMGLVALINDGPNSPDLLRELLGEIVSSSNELDLMIRNIVQKTQEIDISEIPEIKKNSHS